MDSEQTEGIGRTWDVVRGGPPSPPKGEEMHASDTERWRPIEGWLGYEVSDLGRVRSRRVGNRFAMGRLRETPKIVTPGEKWGGYLAVGLSGGNRKTRKSMFVHRLVLEAFVGPCPDGCVACHNDDDRKNNRLDNLRWDTESANRRDAVINGRRKLTEDQIRSIWGRLVAGQREPLIAHEFGISIPYVYKIRNGKCHGWITKDLPGRPFRQESIRTKTAVRPPSKYAITGRETWKKVPGNPQYRISNTGRVQSCWVRVGQGFGQGCRFDLGTEWREIKSRLQPNGYRTVHLSLDGVKRGKPETVHSLMLRVFVGPRPVGMVACHNDGDRSNNHLSNLRWDTFRENSLDRVRHRGR